LNIKSNGIGDEGIECLANALKATPKLKEIDISFNEIGPVGFQALIDVLPYICLETLVCNKNYIGDEIMCYFA
jgi:Ran GTPase-activating protein (RanGAP) involved in mRNA processing and transport